MEAPRRPGGSFRTHFSPVPLLIEAGVTTAARGRCIVGRRDNAGYASQGQKQFDMTMTECFRLKVCRVQDYSRPPASGGEGRTGVEFLQPLEEECPCYVGHPHGAHSLALSCPVLPCPALSCPELPCPCIPFLPDHSQRISPPAAKGESNWVGRVRESEGQRARERERERDRERGRGKQERQRERRERWVEREGRGEKRTGNTRVEGKEPNLGNQQVK